MAELAPSFTDCGCTTAQADRLAWSSLVCREGVAMDNNAAADGNSLKVIDGPSGFLVTVLTGAAFIKGDTVSFQGMYHVATNASSENLDVGPAPTVGSDRIDLIVARVYDSTYSGTDCEWKLEVVTGVASPAPSAPSAGNNAIVLAQVYVTGGSSGVTSGDITDMREPYQICPDSQLPSVITANFYSAADTFVIPDDARALHLRLVGGGGGGGGAVTTGVGEWSAGSGGAGGEYRERWVFAASGHFTPGASLSVAIGAGGAGGGGSPGGPGGSSGIGSLLIADGGGGGDTTGAGTNLVAAGGVPGNAGSDGNAFIGGGGGAAFVTDALAIGGKGGQSGAGNSGPRAVGGLAAGASGPVGARGSGGSGSAHGPEQTAKLGGAGGDGWAYIEAYR